MKLIKRLYVSLLWVIYFLAVITSPLWQLLSLVIFGVDYRKILEIFFNYIWEYNKKNNVFEFE